MTATSPAYSGGTSRLASVAEGTRSTAYAYHAASNLLRSAVHREDGNVRLAEERAYDRLGMLASVASLGSGSTTPVRRSHGYVRNGINQVVGVTREDGFDWAYGYDSDGHLASASRKLPGGTALAGEQFGYDYDPFGNRLEATFGGGSGGTHAIAYTPASGDFSQIDEVETPGVALVTGAAKTTAAVLVDGTAPADRQGGRFAHPVAVDNSTGAALAEVAVSAEEGMDTDYATVKKLVAKENAFYDYDADGNVVSDGFFAYTWDADNRLLSVETLSGAAPAGVAEVKVEYDYDYAGRRIVRRAYRKVSGSWSLEEEQRFVHDGFQVVGEWDGGGDLQRTFLWGADLSGSPGGAGGAGGLVSLAVHGGISPTAHFASYDGGGNLVALTDAADGEASALYEYDPYGNLLASSGPMAEANPFRFGTQWRDAATGLDLYHYRVYDPVHGRWLSRDPIGEAGGLNLYGFLKNAPVGDFDLFGLTSPAQFEELGELAQDLMKNGSGINQYGTVDEVMSGVEEAKAATGGVVVGVAIEVTPWGKFLDLFKWLKRAKKCEKVVKAGGHLHTRPIIVDENLSPALVDALKARGFDPVRMPNGMADADIIKWARQNNASILTGNTRDFVNQGVTVLDVPVELRTREAAGALADRIRLMNAGQVSDYNRPTPSSVLRVGTD